MTRRNPWSISFAVAGLLGLLAADPGCSKQESPAPTAGDEAPATAPATAPAPDTDAWYVCPMAQDNYWQHGSGRCPKCGMHLERAPEGWAPPGDSAGR